VCVSIAADACTLASPSEPSVAVVRASLPRGVSRSSSLRVSTLSAYESAADTDEHALRFKALVGIDARALRARQFAFDTSTAAVTATAAVSAGATGADSIQVRDIGEHARTEWCLGCRRRCSHWRRANSTTLLTSWWCCRRRDRCAFEQTSQHSQRARRALAGSADSSTQATWCEACAVAAVRNAGCKFAYRRVVLCGAIFSVFFTHALTCSIDDTTRHFTTCRQLVWQCDRVTTRRIDVGCVERAARAHAAALLCGGEW
jgi:hypothetical protein